MRTKLVGTCFVGVLVLTGGCGTGNARLSERGFVRESSAVCARANRAIARIETSNLGRLSAKVVAIHRSSVASLRDLRPPRSYEHTAKVWIALIDQTLDEVDAMRTAMRASHDGEAGAYARKATALEARARAIARGPGITPCLTPAFTA
ncbi:MAG: hypothetical protein WD271_14610 [Acidimicrobiia bacterium]